MTKRLPLLDIVRGFAIIMVVFGHSYGWGFQPHHPIIEGISWAFTALRMPVLILISGFLVCRVMDSSTKIVNRASQMIWLYVLWLFPASAASVAVNDLEGKVSISDFMTFLYPSGYLWFIWVLIIYTMLLFVVRHIDRRIVITVAFLLSVASYSVMRMDNFAHGNLLHYGPFFYIGALYAKEFREYVGKPFSVKTVSHLVAIIAVTHVLDSSIRAHNGWQIFGPFERLVICILFIELFKLVPNTNKAGAALAWFGRNTLPIYLAHIPAFVLIRPYVPRLGLVDALTVPLICTVVTIFMSIMLKKLTDRLGAKWVFERPAFLIVPDTRQHTAVKTAC